MKTNKKKIIVVLFSIIALLAGAFWYFTYTTSSKQDPNDTEKNLFPFGEILPGSSRGGGTGQQTDTEDEVTGTSQETIQLETSEEESSQLNLIFEEPTGGFIPLSRTEEQEIITSTTNEEGVLVQEADTIEVENQYIRYTDISSGSIYETKLTGENSFRQELIVDNFIPNAEHAVFSNNGNHIAFQYWNNINNTAESYLATIKLLEYDIEDCSYSFGGSVTPGEEGEFIFNLHKFLNRDPKTQLATSGVNSPGNESSLASEMTIAGIKKFQALVGLEQDGALGPNTKENMLRVCNEQQEELAKEAFESLNTRYEISGSFLPENVISINMSPEKEEVFYLQKNDTGAVGTLRDLLTQERKTLFTSPFSEWTSSWKNQESIELSTKPSYASEGYSYALKTLNGDYRKSFKQRKGLTVLPSNNNEKILVHDVENQRPSLSIYDRLSNSFIPLNIETFTDKCVWSANDEYIYCAVPGSLAYGEEYPDTWYQGLETYSDSLWRINASSLETEVLSNLPVDYGQDIDVERISIDNDSQFLYFIDKNTEFLWSYRLDEV